MTTTKTSPPQVNPPTTPVLSGMDPGALLDLLGPVEEEMDRVENLVAAQKKQAENIRKELNKRVDQDPNALTLRGEVYFAAVGEKNNETLVNLPKLYRAMKREAFLMVCSVGLEKLKALRKDWEKYVTQQRTGSRRLSTHRYPATENVQAKAA